MILPYARPSPRAPRRYASLPAWGWWSNAPGVLAGVALLAVILRSDELSFLLLIMPGAVVVGLHFLLVFLPTLNRALFAERIAPRERLIAIAMACAGPTGVFVATFFWP